MQRIQKKRKVEKIKTAVMGVAVMVGWAGIWAWYFIILTN